MNVHTLGMTYWKKMVEERQASIAMVKSFIYVAEIILQQGGEVSFEWPKSCHGWLIPELISFILFGVCTPFTLTAANAV